MLRIADTFTASLSKLTAQEQKAAKTAAFDLQLNPAQPGLQMHKVDRARDPNFWSARVNRDLRLILHRTDGGVLLCYVDHHDDAYSWAVRRRIEVHPKTGAVQIVEVRERVEEEGAEGILAPKPPSGPRLFDAWTDDELLGFGVPEDWIDAVRQADENALLELVDHLPAEAAEALLNLATDGVATPAMSPPPSADPFEHPDALRRFRVVENVEELERALEFAWEKWTVFLHPAQRAFAERAFTGPARIAGSAGTGKTVVALHRAARLARSADAPRVLLTTFSRPLADALAIKLDRLMGADDPARRRVAVAPLDSIAWEAAANAIGKVELASLPQVQAVLRRAAAQADGEGAFSPEFLIDEWTGVVDAWGVHDWETYRTVPRLGRKTPIGARQREALWEIFEAARAELDRRGLITTNALYHRLAEALAGGAERPFDLAVVDEAQDVSVPQLSFLAALAGDRPDGLFFAGDLGQRIFQPPFSWKRLGVDIRGRSHTLKVNYRTSHQIRGQADRLLDPTLTDMDGVEEDRKGTVSIFNGPSPEFASHPDQTKETEMVAEWLLARAAEGFALRELGVFVRSSAELPRARKAVAKAGLDATELSQRVIDPGDRIAIAPMHLAKGLEFRGVAVMACDDDVIPSQARIEDIADVADLEEVYRTERHLLYVACTRARERLLVTGIDPTSEFLEDMGFEG